MPLLPALRLTGAQTLLEGALHDAPVTLDQGLIVQGQTFAPFEVFLATATIYWGLTALLAAGFRSSERRLGGQARRGFSSRHRLAARYLSLEPEPRS